MALLCCSWNLPVIQLTQHSDDGYDIKLGDEQNEVGWDSKGVRRLKRMLTALAMTKFHFFNQVGVLLMVFSC